MEKQIINEYFSLQLTPQQLNEAMDVTRNVPMIIKKVLLQKKDSKNRNGRIYPGNILEREISEYDDNFVKPNRALGELDHCFLENNFDILSEKGWKSFSEIEVGENVLSFNIDKNIYEYKEVLRKIDNEYEGDGYHIKGRHIDSKFSPEHKLLIEDRYGIKKYVTIEEIYNNRTKYNKCKILKTGNLNTDVSDKFILKGLEKTKGSKNLYINDIEVETKILAAIIGIWLSDGSTKVNSNKKTGQILIHQNIGDKYEEIIELLKNSPFDWYSRKKSKNEKQMTIFIKNHQLYNYLKPLGNTYNKYIPQEIKNFDKESLENLLYFFNLGDGRKQYNQYGKRLNVFTVSKRMIDDLQECLIKTGSSGNLTIAHKAGSGGNSLEGRIIYATEDLHQLNFSMVSGIYLDDRFVKINKIQHKGKKYCIEVKDNHSFYTRQNNKCFISGNCSEPQVNLKNVSHIIKNIYWEGDSCYGDLEILDGSEFPAGRIAAGLLKRGIPVGISSRGLGSVTELDEGIIVNDDFKLITFDLVSYESTIGSNFSLNESRQIINDKYNKIDDLIHELICNNSTACSCMFTKK